MRECINNMLPLPQNNVDGIMFNSSVKTITNVSSNAYYGYQPAVHLQQKEGFEDGKNIPVCAMDIQLNNNNVVDEEMQIQNEIPRLTNRKRAWEHHTNDCPDLKKKRENEPDPVVALSPALYAPKAVHLRKPTHNIPDLPRCIMENKIGSRTKQSKVEDKSLEELLLRETHGCSYYHWIANDS